MVDAAMSFRGQSSPETARARLSGDAKATVSVASAGHLDTYRDLAARGIFAPPQDPSWVAQWAAHAGADSLVAIVEQAGRPVYALALEVVRSGPFRIARFMGGSHANGNFPAIDPQFPGSGAFDAPALLQAIRAARPDVDALVLERMQPALGDAANPLLALPHFPSPNLSLAVDLDGGFEALLSRVSGKRKRKKYRSQTRKFEAAGGFQRFQANNRAEVERVLGAFFEMKAVRFRKMGIADPFGDPQVQAFFRALFSDALAISPPPFVLHALEVGGTLRAVTGSSLSGNRIVCEFGAIAEDELAQTSPGDFLFFENIGEACRDGLAIYDFSVGDEPYKRQWCDVETTQFDVVAPLSLKGHMLARGLRLKTAAKAYVKNNPALWRMTKMLRRKTAGDERPAEEE